jgi:hypothetical protein
MQECCWFDGLITPILILIVFIFILDGITIISTHLMEKKETNIRALIRKSRFQDPMDRYPAYWLGISYLTQPIVPSQPPILYRWSRKSNFQKKIATRKGLICSESSLVSQSVLRLEQNRVHGLSASGQSPTIKAVGTQAEYSYEVAETRAKLEMPVADIWWRQDGLSCSISISVAVEDI